MFHHFPRQFLICVMTLWLCSQARTAGAQQSSDLNRLAHPEVSERLGLDDAQRADIQRLLQERTEATVIEDADEKKEELAEIDQQIRETLSDEQWEQWQNAVPTGGLKFQFREQDWADVLQWFAEQEGLTLVMDRAPPGTFTYSDTREYTSAQAIDLLNSVLLTRGYTLVRREKMLTLLQLSDSIPIELIPEVTLEELPSRGRFELVRVQFSLGTRPVDAVMKEVTPYLGSFGRAIPLPQSRQLVVIEAAGKMETINVLVNSVPEPKKEQPAKAKEKPPEPVFAAYSLGAMDGEAVLETIGNLIGSDGVAVDEQARLLTAFVVPGKQKAIQSAIEQMQSSLEETPAATSVAYELTGGSPDAIREQLATLAPRAVIAVDSDSERLLVTASPDDQEKISTALTALGISRQSAPSALRAFQVEAGEASQLASALQTMLPDSQVVGNDTLGTLVVRGPDDDLELADEVIRRWSGEETLVDKGLHAFPLPHPADSDWLTTVSKLVPKAEIWLDSSGEQLVLLGSQAERQRIESALPELVTAIPRQPARELRTHSLAPAELERWQELQESLAAQLEDVQFVIQQPTAGRAAEILVWATAEDHQRIEDLLEQIKASTPEAEMLWPRAYPLADRDAELVGQLVETSFPGVRWSVDDSAEQMTIWAVRETHEQIAELLTAVQAELPSQPKMQFRSYRLPGMEASALQNLISPILSTENGDGSATVDTDGNRLLVRANEETHQQLDALLKELREPPPADQEKILMAYTLEHADAADLKTVLDAAVRGATVVADAERGQLIATATLQQHGQIKTIVGEIDRPGSASNTKEIRSYSLRDVQASAVLPTLESLWPRMELSVDEEANQIIASGTAAEHQALRTALDRLGSSSTEEDLRVETYSVPVGDLQSLPAVLAQIAPQAVISTDQSNRTLVVWAADAQHQRIGQALDQLSESASRRDEILLFQVPPEEVSTFQSLLASLFPSAKVAVNNASGQLTVLAPTPLREQITDLIEERLQAAESVEQPEARSYQIDRTIRSAFTTLLETTAPRATLVNTDAGGSDLVMVLAVSEDHDKIETMLERLKEQVPPSVSSELRVHQVRDDLAEQAADGMATVVPDATLLPGGSSSRLVVLASAEDHQRLTEWLEQLQESVPAPEGKVSRVHPVASGNAESAVRVLQTLLPDVTFAADQEGRSLAATATEGAHAMIADFIEQYDLGTSESLQTKSYVLENSNPITLQRALAGMYPQATVAADSSSGGLLVAATAEQHEQIAGLVEELNAAPGRSGTLTTYRLQEADPEEVATALQRVFGRRSSAGVSADREAGMIFVVGQPDQQKIAADLIEQMDRSTAETELRVYPIRDDLAGQAADGVATVAPKASLLPGGSSQRLVVLASAEDHQRLAEWFEQLQESVPAPEGKVSRVYPVPSGNAASAVPVLQTLLPDVTFAADQDGKSLAATATEGAHETIADFIQQYDQGLRNDAQTRVFSLGRGDARTLAEAVSQMAPGAGVSAERSSNTLIVTAPAETMEEVAKLVQEVENGTDESLQTKSYVLENSNPITLQRALAGMYPQATVAADSSSGGLLVAATAEQHEQIAGLVEQLNAAPGQTGTLTTHRLQQADPEEVASALQQAFGRRSSAGVSADRDSGMVFVVGQPDQQRIAADLIEQMDRVDTGRQPRELKVFATTGGNGSEVASAVERLFDSDRSPVDVEYDMVNEQLVVIGTDEQLRRVEESLQQFEPPDRQLEIFALTANDPEPVRDAIESLFSDLPYNATPSVLIDENRQQLLVRATAEQLEQIGQLLGRLDESSTPAGGRSVLRSSRVRSISVGQDSEQILQRLQEIWPSVRENPLKVIRPTQRDESRPRPEASENPREAGRPDDADDSHDAEKSNDSGDARQQPAPQDDASLAVPGKRPHAKPAEAKTTVAFRAPLPQGPLQAESSKEATVDPEISEQSDDNADVTPAPVVIVPGPNSWTIASEDPAAVQALAELIESAAAAPVTAFDTGTNHSVYVLRHADANELQTVLTNLFQQGRSRRFRTSSDQTTVVADPRINAVIVRGSRSDRRTVEELLAVLDSPEFVGTFDPSPPQYVPVENTDAGRVEQILRTVYSSQLTSGRGRPPITIPAGISEEMRTMLRQINAEASGPLLTLSVDDVTNAIVMRAPPELADEVQSFIEQVDQQADSGRGRGMRIIPLHESNAQGMQEALEALRAAAAR